MCRSNTGNYRKKLPDSLLLGVDNREDPDHSACHVTCAGGGRISGKSFVARAAGPIQTPARRQQALTAPGFNDLRNFQASVDGLAVEAGLGL